MRKLIVAVFLLASVFAQAPQTVRLTVNVDQPGAKIDPIFYGLMTEEINFSYDGGLYAELIRNRTFRDDAQTPVHWTAFGGGSITLENDAVPGTALTKALKLNASSASAGGRASRPPSAGRWPRTRAPSPGP